MPAPGRTAGEKQHYWHFLNTYTQTPAFCRGKSALYGFDILRLLLVGWKFNISSLKSERVYFRIEIGLCTIKHGLYWHYKINLQQT